MSVSTCFENILLILSNVNPIEMYLYFNFNMHDDHVIVTFRASEGNLTSRFKHVC